MASINSSVAVIGAGPAGLFAARELAKTGADVALINRDIKPGGAGGIRHLSQQTQNEGGFAQAISQST